MVLKNLFTGNIGETENRLNGHVERVIFMVIVTWKPTLPYVKSIANGNLLYAS